MRSSARLIAPVLFFSLILGIDGYICESWELGNVSENVLISRCENACGTKYSGGRKCDTRTMLREFRMYKHFVCISMTDYCLVAGMNLTTMLLLAVGLPLVLLIIGIFIFCCWSRARKRRKEKERLEREEGDEEETPLVDPNTQPGLPASPEQLPNATETQGPLPIVEPSQFPEKAPGLIDQPAAVPPVTQPTTATADKSTLPRESIVETAGPNPSSSSPGLSGTATSEGPTTERTPSSAHPNGNTPSPELTQEISPPNSNFLANFSLPFSS